MNNVVYDNEDIHEDFRVPKDTMEESGLRDMSFGDFLIQTVDSLYYIFDHKVLLIQYFLIFLCTMNVQSIVQSCFTENNNSIAT